MKISLRQAVLSVIAALTTLGAYAVSAIRVNQVGYLPDDIKVAVYISSDTAPLRDATIVNTLTGARNSVRLIPATPWEPMAQSVRLDFSNVTEPGRYRIEAAGEISPEFGIGEDIYQGLNEIPLHYMRQQRCGYNPSLGTRCHSHDGILVLAGDKTGTHVDVTGGWHDASDYLQYLTTSANAVYQMLFAYRSNPEVWVDAYLADGTPGSNGVPDILDEARWGLEWMMKMNPSDTLFLNQIADDRDHKFYGLPADDTADYGWGAGKDRPVYPCSAEPYGLFKYKNRSRGLASSVGKFASSFAAGAETFAEIDPEFSNELLRRAENAYKVAKASPGNCQTAPCVSPYYYEEDNYADDMELAAAQLYRICREDSLMQDAIDFGRLEPVTPWMGADSARHYQWYPFINLGHALIASEAGGNPSREFIRNIRSGLARVRDKGQENAFLCGLPFIWCSNNLAAALVTQGMIYRELTGDDSFRDIETATRDWLLGCNPWGTSMIVGLPEGGNYPTDPHSALSHKYGIRVTGGLVDGPICASKYNSLWGVHLERPDRYEPFQNSTVVYHDDNADYSTNEPTMDGTASTTYFLGKLASKKK